MKSSEKQSSTVYEWFRFLTNNRPINNHHIRELEKEFDKYGNITEVSPITVNKAGFIIDGQHRKIICERRGLPIHYIIVDAPKEITVAMNWRNKPWLAMDYINFYAAYKPEYELLRQFMSHNRINYQIASAVLFTGLNRKFTSDRRLKEGTLEVKSILNNAQAKMDIVSEIGMKIGAELHERYVRGIMKCLENEDFDLERFNKKLDVVMKQSPSLPNPRLRAMEDVMRNLESIYNYMASDRTRVILFR